MSKKDPMDSMFIERLEAKIKETQGLNGEVLKPQWQAIQKEIDEYFEDIKARLLQRVDMAKSNVKNHLEKVLEQEAGYHDYDKIKADLMEKREAYQNADKANEGRAFDAYFALYNNSIRKIEKANDENQQRINDLSGLMKVEKRALEEFQSRFESNVRVLESDFNSNIGFIANHLDPQKFKLEEHIQIPSQGCWRGLTYIEQLDVFVAGGLEGKIAMYDAKTLKLLDVCNDLEKFITTIIYIPEENVIVCGGADIQISVRKADPRGFGRHIKHIGTYGFVSFLAYMPDKELFASIGGDDQVRLHSSKTFEYVEGIKTNHKNYVPRGNLIYLQDKGLLCCGFEDGFIDFYNIEKRQIAFGIIADEKGSYFGMLYQPKERKLLAHTKSGKIKVWKFDGERPMPDEDLLIENEGPRPMGLFMVKNFLLSCSDQDNMAVFDLQEKKAIKKIHVPGFKCQMAAFSQRHQRIIVSDEKSNYLVSIKTNPTADDDDNEEKEKKDKNESENEEKKEN